jgi:hypothetical protein
MMLEYKIETNLRPPTFQKYYDFDVWQYQLNNIISFSVEQQIKQGCTRRSTNLSRHLTEFHDLKN